MTPVLQFRVVGSPAPQGSKDAYVNKHTGRAQMKESSAKVTPWRQDVVAAAEHAMDGTDWNPPARVKAIIAFYFRRPKSHYRTGRFSNHLRDDAPLYHSTKPDIDKLCRSTFDALTTAGAIKDDCTIARVDVAKFYAVAARPTGASIRLSDADDGST